MDIETTNAARLYYEMIVNNNNTSFKQKKELIYNDLVIGSRTELSLVCLIFIYLFSLFSDSNSKIHSFDSFYIFFKYRNEKN